MTLSARLQTAAIDTAGWLEDSEFAVYPQGARAKQAVFAPDEAPDPCLTPHQRYLFKWSKGSYPDQFWSEIIAYRVGCLLGVEVPPAYAAFDSETGISAALIEWFYQDEEEVFIQAGEFLQAIWPDFERVKGEAHNLQDIELLMRVLRSASSRMDGWRMWWLRTLLFDALIGNTDRHQDNWGFVLKRNLIRLQPEHALRSLTRIAPAFDNGTSLGHERFVDKVSNWTDEQFSRYIQKGKHHVKLNLQDSPPLRAHIGLIQAVLNSWPELDRDALRKMLQFDPHELDACIADLSGLELPIRLEPGRLVFVLELLHRRHAILKELLK